MKMKMNLKKVMNKNYNEMSKITLRVMAFVKRHLCCIHALAITIFASVEEGE